MKYNDIKRILDIILSINLIIISSPILLTIAILIKLDSEGPIFFKQERLGKNGKIFNIYKFRSMAKDNNVLNFTEKDKVTILGKFMRKYGLDELPQLFNILKGDMSFIGPRPQLPIYFQYYTEEELKRFDVLPGILGPNTCLHYHRTIEQKNKLDVDYVDNYSFKQDLNTVLITFKNARKILKYREKSSEGNKSNVQEELKYLKNNQEKSQNTSRHENVKIKYTIDYSNSNLPEQELKRNRQIKL